MNNTDSKDFTNRFKNKLQAISWHPWLLVASGVFMAHMSWLKWPDLVIDFGEQAYIAWQLSEGVVLYRDITYGYGPLSSYLHAFLFKVFGPQLIILFVFNLILVILLTFLIYRLFSFFGTKLSATVAGATFLILFAFAQYIWMGNHNFICSYVYGIVHGIFLCFLGAYCFQHFILTRRTIHFLTTGVVTGLILLTKIEVALAWVTAITVALIYVFKHWNLKIREWGLYAGGFILSLGIPVFAFTAFFSYQVGVSEAIRFMLIPWSPIWDTSIRSIPFFQYLMGTNAVGDNLITMILYLLSWLSLLIILASINHSFRNYFKSSNILIGFGITLFLFVMTYFQSQIPWLELLRPLPLMMLGLTIYAALTLLMKKESNPAEFSKIVVQLTLTIFSLTLLLKIILNTHVYHYGTALAMPATLILFKFLVDDLPERVKIYSKENHFYKGSTLAAIALFIFNHHLVSHDYYSKKVFPIADAGDKIIGYHPNIEMRSVVFQIALDVLKENIKSGDTLATIPSGALLNYLSRTPQSTNAMYINPVSIEMIGENIFLGNLQEQPPSYIAIVYHDFYEFEYRIFGKDFGMDIYQWILENYDSFKVIGKDPVKGEGFGIHLYKLKSTTLAPS